MPSESTSTNPMDWLNAVTSAAYPATITIIVLLFGVLLALPRLRSFARRPPTTPPAVPKCFRIQQIPATVTKEELLHQLTKSLPGLGSQPPDSLRLKVASSFGQYCTATFVSTEAPKNLEYPVDLRFNGVTPLYEGENALVDIIAVHGLGSHAIGGFQSKDTKMVWLRDFLSNDVPNSRILVYGYDSAITDKNNKVSIAGLAKSLLDSCKAFRQATKTTQRPIVFIGHSLGGLLVKEALFMAFQGDGDLENSNFFKSTYALMFFGVPNLGIRLGKLQEITSGQLNKQLIDDLQLDSESEPTPYLRALQERFISCHKKQDPPMRIISYYEEKMTDTPTVDKSGKVSRGGHMCFMVTQDSACRIGFEDDTHNKLPLPSDHSNLVKFLNEADDSYRRVQNKLRELVTDGPEVISRRFISATKLSPEEKRHWDDLNVPDYRAFIENEEKLAKPIEGTLQWLVQEDLAEEMPDQKAYDTISLQKKDFEAWQGNSESCSLLVVGPPGQGKSVLSNFVVKHLQQKSIDKRNLKVIYFFCNIKDENSTASSILRALIVQLCQDQRLFRKLPNRLQGSREFHSTQFDDLWRTFDDLVCSSPFDWIYCIIDGLDVYEDTQMEILVRKLHGMVKTDTAYRLKLFLTSRPTGPVGIFTPEMRRALRPPRKDITVFIENQVKLLPSTFNNFKSVIQQSLFDSAGDTFLWIDLVMRDIQKLRWPNKHSIRKKIEDAPTDLTDLYNTLIRVAFKDGPGVAILAWVAYAKEPLSIEALETAVAVILTNANSWAECDEQKTPLQSSSIYAYLGTLVDVIDNRLYLIHQSLLDFLKGNPAIWQEGDLGSKFRRPNLELGRACMTYLSFGDLDFGDESVFDEESRFSDEFESDYSESSYGSEPDANSPFIDYASNYWYEHIESAEDVMEDTEKLKCILEGQNKKLWLARNRRYFRRYYERRPEESIPGISLLCDIGWLARLLMDQRIPEISDGFTDHDLIIAARRAPKVFRELLQDGALPKVKVTWEAVRAAVQNLHNSRMMLELLLEKISDEVRITPEVVIAAVVNRYRGKEILELLLEKRGDKVQITPEVVLAAVGNWHQGKEILELLLEKRGDKVQITPEVVLAAVGNRHQGKEILELLLEKRGDEVQITPEVVLAAVDNGHQGEEILELLLEKRGDEVQITPEVVLAAADNGHQGEEILELLLEKRGDEVQITPEVVLAAADNGHQGKEILELLLEKRGDEVQITPEVVLAAAGNRHQGKEILKLLLEKRGDEVQITPEVVLAAAGNRYGEEILRLLLEKRGDEIRITPEVVTAAAGNHYYGGEILRLLLEKRGDEVQITPEVVLAAAGNRYGEEILKLLLEKRGDEIRITPEVVTAAANKRILNLLLEKRVN